MEAFNAAYPWMVLSVGCFDAAVFALGGLSFAAIIAFGKMETMADRIFPATFCMAIMNALAIAALAATRWVLGVG